MPPDATLVLRLRDLLAQSGRYEISRLDDHQVRAASISVLHAGASLRNLADIATVLAFFSRSVAGDQIGLRQLLERAVELLDFSVDPNRGLLYSGQYATLADPWQPPDSRLTDQIRAGSNTPGTEQTPGARQAAAGKTAIGQTDAGRWLLRWNLRYLIGGDGEDAIWVRATGRFIEALSGEVEVFLAFAEFDRVFRALPAHPIFKIPEIKRIVYYLDDNAGRILNPSPELFNAGVVKQAFGKELVFRATAK
jgi:hypothetical protein